ncbi:uncharacterized protein LOC127007800 [Eriocheir sinensis]|uniref:uncharacterized protein LOC127007800 n=1 Tax=Eriocheir sinensis TaxID=95602 RepID=UPI0021C928D9|nr:uncharacterized protein LOC127007800 [Eriocheir sinensis]
MDQEESGPRIIWGQRADTDPDMVYFDHDNPTNLTVLVGHRANLPCRVLNLNNNNKKNVSEAQQVSWIRQRDLHILTVGIYTYTADDRFKVVHATENDEWTLEINPVAFRDAGVYECQVSSSPKISLPISLSVEAQKARIEGPAEVYIKNGSTIRLTCRINTHYDNVGAVIWFRDTHRLDYDSPRGGVSIEIEKTPTHTTSKLFITPALRGDSGNYTCGPQCAAPASVLVLVVNGEESAAVHKAGSAAPRPDPRVLWCCLMLMLMLMMMLSVPQQQENAR